jgi:hypothetical protein
MSNVIDSILNIVIPAGIIGGMIALFWKPFRLGLLFGWIGRKIENWREKRDDNRNPVNRLEKKEIKWVFE